MKTLAQYICPRCLVLKTDVPQIGKDFDMNRRHTNPRKYSLENVDIARKAIFDSGRSVGYKGEINPLKVGSWVPTRVRSPFTLVLESPDGAVAEHICYRTQSGSVTIDGRRHHARRRAWRWQSHYHAYPPVAFSRRWEFNPDL